jgi:hypothetical protein
MENRTIESDVFSGTAGERALLISFLGRAIFDYIMWKKDKKTDDFIELKKWFKSTSFEPYTLLWTCEMLNIDSKILIDKVLSYENNILCCSFCNLNFEHSSK